MKLHSSKSCYLEGLGTAYAPGRMGVCSRCRYLALSDSVRGLSVAVCEGQVGTDGYKVCCVLL
jgi:hypothetical protein